MKLRRKRKPLSSAQIIILGFISMILIGTILLMMPFSCRGWHMTPFLEALFTATSASCVTGLVVHDTATYWSTFGQIVILIMIQIGGMGVVTMAVFIAMISGKKIGLAQRSTMQEAVAAHSVGGIVRLTGFIFKGTILIEGLGAVLLSPAFIREYGPLKGICYGIFHSISAFCNAGFDLMGIKEPYSSMTSYVGHPWINTVLMLLIVIGGLGFLTWEDMLKNRFSLKRYRLQSKMVLAVTAILLIFPAVYFYFGEFSASGFRDMTGTERLFGALFQSVTARTAGFNTVDLGRLSESGKAIFIVLMLIGGSPGSTAGGMKTTTAAVLIITAISIFRRREDAQCFGRRIDEDAVKYAATILVMYIVLFVSAGIIISSVEDLPILTALFETASAIGTVGVTLGITPSLGAISRILIIILMFMGRVGGLTLVFAAVAGARTNGTKLPQEKITVG